MSKSRELLLIAMMALAAAPALAGADGLGLGRTATETEVAAWDIDVRPDGAGLPVGSGDVLTGEEVFADNCAMCHGDFGEGVDRWPVLAGGQGTLTDARPVKTIGSYWPYLSTVYDYIYRAMPFGYAQSLEPDDVYAITAYLLYVNDLVEDDFELSNENFAEMRLPNEDNFFMDDRPDSPLFGQREVCMKDCKPEVKITMRARVLDVTPDEEKAAAEAAAPAASAETAAAKSTAAETPAAAPEPAAVDAELAAAGAKVFKKCKACHQVGAKAKNRTGPILTGIVDAPMGGVDGFTKYSKALKAKAEEGAVWDAAALDAFLAKPKDYLKGTKMNFKGLSKDADRQAIIEYLRSVAQ